MENLDAWYRKGWMKMKYSDHPFMTSWNDMNQSSGLNKTLSWDIPCDDSMYPSTSSHQPMTSLAGTFSFFRVFWIGGEYGLGAVVCSSHRWFGHHVDCQCGMQIRYLGRHRRSF